MKNIDLSQYGDKTIVNQGEYIYERGTNAKRMYRIERGTVFLSSINDSGQKLIESIKVKGDYIGFAELIGAKEYLQSAYCVDEVELVSIDYDHFLELMHDKEFNEDFVELLADEVMNKQERIVCFAYCSVHKRLLSAMIKLDESLNTKKEYPFYVQIKRIDLAALSGTVKETVIRKLKELEEDEVIELLRGGVRILDRKKMEEQVHSAIL